MLILCFKSAAPHFYSRLIALVVIVAFSAVTSLPSWSTALAETTATTTADGTDADQDQGSSTSTNEILVPVNESNATSTTETGTTTDTAGGDTSASSTNETSTSTNDGVSGQGGETGIEGSTGSMSSSTVDTGTSTNDGVSGDPGVGIPPEIPPTNDATTTLEAEDEGEPVPVLAENEVGFDPTPEDGEGVTGGKVQSGKNSTIITSDARAQGEILNDVNSSNVRSEFEGTFTDLDTYTFQATGTNDATITNQGTASSLTGKNAVYSTNISKIFSGDAVSAMNIANVVNSNVVNSDGYLYLKNQVIEAGSTVLDLGDFFFPDEASTLADATDCTLMSCMSEDVVYNFSQFNTATVTNEASIVAISGDNYADGDFVEMETGNAYGSANVINVVNSNIIDSNYRLLTLNALGDLDGDLILPTETMFKAFYGKPNGLTQTEDAESKVLIAESTNVAHPIDNNLDTYAESGLNESDTIFENVIETGDSDAESNVLNKINTNVFGGDTLYLLIRVHGVWSGEVRGLPEGLSWQYTQEGILIYNTEAEIEPSAIIPYDVDTYTAKFTDQNYAAINNDISIEAVSGKNEMVGLTGGVTTGNAFASANVMNIANTNVIGANWTMAIINIFGDFDGNVTFSQTDLGVTGSVASVDGFVKPGSVLEYTYLVSNDGEATATGVSLIQTLQSATTPSGTNQQTIPLGSIAPGQTRSVVVRATIDPTINLDLGTTTVQATARLTRNESDMNISNDTNLLSLNVVKQIAVPPTVSSGGGGGGGSHHHSKAKIKRGQEEVLSASLFAPLSITKDASVAEGATIEAGEQVDYVITVTNRGAKAYDAVVADVLRNGNGSTIDQQSWELGTIKAGEKIELTYSTTYSTTTPTGAYVNTASLIAYGSKDSKTDGKKPLTVTDAVYTINIEGVDLAIHNVGVLAYFPLGDGTVSALVTWETSQPSLSQVFYSPSGPVSPYNANLSNYGYLRSSFRFPNLKTKHYMIIGGLGVGARYTYRINASGGGYDAISRDYSFTVPAVVASLIIPGLNLSAQSLAGVSVSAPITQSTQIP